MRCNPEAYKNIFTKNCVVLNRTKMLDDFWYQIFCKGVYKTPQLILGKLPKISLKLIHSISPKEIIGTIVTVFCTFIAEYYCHVFLL